MSAARKKGQTGRCIRCGDKFVRNYPDHIVCKPGCNGK